MAITIIIIIAVLVVTTHPSLLYASGVPLDRLETQGGAHSWLPSSLRIDDSHHRSCWCWGCVAMIILMAITITIVVITRPGLLHIRFKCPVRLRLDNYHHHCW